MLARGKITVCMQIDVRTIYKRAHAVPRSPACRYLQIKVANYAINFDMCIIYIPSGQIHKSAVHVAAVTQAEQGTVVCFFALPIAVT